MIGDWEFKEDLREMLQDRDELLEAAQREIEGLRAKLAVAVEALDKISADGGWDRTISMTAARKALAKIRGGA